MTWIAPLCITILATSVPVWVNAKKQTTVPEVEALILVGIYLIAIIVSLLSWLVWAVVT